MNYFEKANEFYSVKDYKKALEFYKKAIESKDNEASAYYNSGVCLIKLKDYQNAMALLKKALKIRDESKYYFNLAYCYAMTKNNKMALIYFNRAWCLDNDDKDCEKAINLIVQNYRSKTS
ncbi:tetratricopeptide repeat protein [Clostridium oryzae]|uniref:TPR repeat-containing protein YrrB n=1 Tax=Clostridium oryzae TaxID=1450648 RepID=A0A1V4IER3_9CLOT|nr:tetratricopeptide repeat protein [Clostridium oryzae]OPJ58498.1 TPR repeat-containing protein YrrB [Clostridium oryzae]